MSATSSVKSVSEMLQQSMPEATKRYLDKLAAEINARGQGLTEDDLCTAQGWHKEVPRETLQIGEMRPPGLPSGAKDISIEETHNLPLDAEFLDLAYTMQNMGLETVSNMMWKLYAATAKSYSKHKGEPLKKFRPDPEKTLSQQLVVWKHRQDNLLEDRE
ncbi:hypothetical protein BDD12DRAFT_887087 [Trichophaea hybrida]|nr:hypothetical protein BDD12DRAFT_887087 [Trichophaea hybrida]